MTLHIPQSHFVLILLVIISFRRLSPEITGLLIFYSRSTARSSIPRELDSSCGIFACRASSHQVIGLLRNDMKSLVEAVAIILLLFLTPLVAAGVLIRLVRIVENIGDLPID
jgi:hypothetical protein